MTVIIQLCSRYYKLTDLHFAMGKKAETYRHRSAESNRNYGVQYRAESSRGMGILGAAQRQLMHVTGASMYSVRSWAAMYFECKIGIYCFGGNG